MASSSCTSMCAAFLAFQQIKPGYRLPTSDPTVSRLYEQSLIVRYACQRQSDLPAALEDGPERYPGSPCHLVREWEKEITLTRTSTSVSSRDTRGAPWQEATMSSSLSGESSNALFTLTSLRQAPPPR